MHCWQVGGLQAFQMLSTCTRAIDKEVERPSNLERTSAPVLHITRAVRKLWGCVFAGTGDSSIRDLVYAAVVRQARLCFCTLQLVERDL